MDRDGKNIKQLTTEGTFRPPFAWSPDGKTIAYLSNQDEKQAIFLMDINSKKNSQLTNDEFYNQDPAWSPDSKKIAFAAYPLVRETYVLNEVDIFIMDGDGENKKMLTLHNDICRSPVWSPDSSQIIFECNVDRGPLELFIMASDGSNMLQLTKNEDNDEFPVFSPLCK